MSWVVHSTVPYPILTEPDTPRMLSDAGVGPEIYLSGATLDAMTPSEAETSAERLRKAGIRSLSFHAPFEDVWPGARDEEARRFAVRRIEGAIALAPVLRPAGIVLHGGDYELLLDFKPGKRVRPGRRSLCQTAE